MLAVSEALLFAEAGGLDLEQTLNAVKDGAAGSWMLSNRGAQAIVRDFRPGFTFISTQDKDFIVGLTFGNQWLPRNSSDQADICPGRAANLRGRAGATSGRRQRLLLTYKYMIRRSIGKLRPTYGQTR